MDLKECINKKIVKTVKKDQNLIKSTKQIAEEKIKSSEMLPDDLCHSKISLLYDALREYLECLAMEKGYKIYNHECYTAFLKEIMGMSNESHLFDNLRKIRNGINYYGRQISKEDSKKIIADLKLLITKFR